MIKSTFFTDKKVLIFGFGNFVMGIVLSHFDVPHSLDARFYYSFDQASQYISSLTPDQVDKYLLNEFIDLGFIFFYSSFLYVAFSRFFHKSFLGIKYLGLVPGIFDFIETKSIILVLNKTVDPSLFYWLGSVTAAKWTFGGICFIILVVNLLSRLNFFKLTKT